MIREIEESALKLRREQFRSWGEIKCRMDREFARQRVEFSRVLARAEWLNG